MIDDREATIDDLIKIVKGPDFPTGAMIMGKGNIKNAYESEYFNKDIDLQTGYKTNKRYISNTYYRRSGNRKL